MAKAKEQMRERAWNAILSNAFFSIESAVIIAVSIYCSAWDMRPSMPGSPGIGSFLACWPKRSTWA